MPIWEVDFLAGDRDTASRVFFNGSARTQTVKTADKPIYDTSGTVPGNAGPQSPLSAERKRLAVRNSIDIDPAG